MLVSIKSFDVAKDVKNKGIELSVSDSQGAHLGDLVITKTRLIWCKGKTKVKNGKPISWDQFMAYMDQRD